MSMSVAIFYGTTTGNTEAAAKISKEELGDCVVCMQDVSNTDPADIEKAYLILFGVSTWNIGEMQDDWADFIPKMEGLNLSGKKVAFFALGDASGYPDNFLDAMGELWEVVRNLGDPQLIGIWPTEGYEFDESRGKFDDDHFIGLGLDEDNEPMLTDERIRAWLAQVKQEAGLVSTEVPAT
jgi:flavodoxin I